MSPRGGRGEGTWQHFLYPPVLQNWVLLRHNSKHTKGLPRWHSGKESTCQCRRHGFKPWVRKISWSRKWQLIPVFLPGKFHGQRSLAGYNPWGHKESDMTEWLSMHAHTKEWIPFKMFDCKLVNLWCYKKSHYCKTWATCWSMLLKYAFIAKLL